MVIRMDIGYFHATIVNRIMRRIGFMSETHGRVLIWQSMLIYVSRLFWRIQTAKTSISIIVKTTS